MTGLLFTIILLLIMILCFACGTYEMLGLIRKEVLEVIELLEKRGKK